MCMQVKPRLKQAMLGALSAAGYNENEVIFQGEEVSPWYVRESDWRDDEGVLYDKFGKKRAYSYENGVEFPIVGRNEAQTLKPKQQLDVIADMRRDCFSDGFCDYKKARFATLAPDSDEWAVKAASSYVSEFQKNKVEGRGLIFNGAFGVGKTHLAACMCNAILELGKRCKMTSIDNLTDEHFSVSFSLKTICKYAFVVIDDFGSERVTSTSQNNTFQVFKRLDEAKIPFVVTTNLTTNQLTRPDKASQRVLDRVKHRNKIIEVKGKNRRQEALF